MNKAFLTLFIIVLLGVSFAAGGYVVYSLGMVKPGTVMAPPRERPVNPNAPGVDAARQSVVALGRLEPDGGIINVGVSVPDRVESIAVKEGDEVKKEQKLAQLESHDDRVADRNLTNAQLDEARKRLLTINASGQAQIKEAESLLKYAKEVEPKEIAAQQARVRLLEKSQQSAEAELKRLKDLSAGSVPQQMVDLQTLAKSKADEELSAARSQLERLDAGHDNNVESAQAKVESAKASLARFQAEIPIESLKSTLALADLRLRRTIIHAPSNGKILKVLAHAGETLGTRPLLQMADTSQMIAVAEVYETDVQYVKKGSKATITSRALPEPMTGKVEQIGSVVAKNRNIELDPTAAADARIVEVKIRLDPPDASKKAAQAVSDFINLQVKVTINVSP